MRRNKRWFGPLPAFGKVIYPASWEGWAVTIAFLFGVALVRLDRDYNRCTIATVLLVAGYFAVVLLTWSNDLD